MALDMRTILVIMVFLTGIIAFTMWQIHLTHRGKIPGTFDWFLSFLLDDLGLALVSLRGILPDFISIVIANTLMVLAVCFWVRATALLTRKTFPSWVIVVLPVLFICFDWWFTSVSPSLFHRAIASSAVPGFGAFVAVFYLLRSRRSEFRGGVFLFLAMGTLFLLRIVGIIVFRYQGNWMTNVPIDTLYMIAMLGIFLGMGFIYLRMIDSLVMTDLRISNEDNKLLFREMRHRTKNNLALISSLVSLQANTVSDDDARAAFNVLESRLRTISSVYSQLSETPTGKSVPVGSYLSAVIAGVRDGLAAGRQIEFRTDFSATELEQTALVPLGLVLNELVINAVKYAFPEDRAGAAILVSFSEAGGNCVLRVADNGVGMPQAHSGNGIGLSLVEALAGQLKGSVVFGPAPGSGALCTMTFPGIQG